jgi:hypothetical protein
LIHRTIPVVGEAAPTLPSDSVPVPRHERNAQQRARKPNAGNGNGNRHANARPQANGNARPQSANAARPQPGGPKGDGTPWWERPTGDAPKGTAGKVKPRWNKGKKDAAKVVRPDNRPQRAPREAIAS